MIHVTLQEDAKGLFHTCVQVWHHQPVIFRSPLTLPPPPIPLYFCLHALQKVPPVLLIPVPKCHTYPHYYPHLFQDHVDFFVRRIHTYDVKAMSVKGTATARLSMKTDLASTFANHPSHTSSYTLMAFSWRLPSHGPHPLALLHPACTNARSLEPPPQLTLCNILHQRSKLPLVDHPVSVFIVPHHGVPKKGLRRGRAWLSRGG